jgi:hypothetical protein
MATQTHTMELVHAPTLAMTQITFGEWTSKKCTPSRKCRLPTVCHNYTERLNGVEVYVGDHTNWKNNAKCGSVASAGLKPVINCDGKAGRFVQVRVPRKEWLSLCEVLVEATVSTTQHTLIPLAGKPVEQSGNHGSYTASRAIDGDANQNFGSGKCSHTNKGPNPTWWRVDLQGTYKVSQVEIFNSGTDQR